MKTVYFRLQVSQSSGPVSSEVSQISGPVSSEVSQSSGPVSSEVSQKLAQRDQELAQTDDRPSLQGLAIQLFRISDKGRVADEHGLPAAGGGVAVFGIVKGGGGGATDEMPVSVKRQELIVIDPFFDDSVLPLIAQKRQGVAVVVVKNMRKGLLHDVDVARFNAQYGNSLMVKKSKRFYDRLCLLVDGQDKHTRYNCEDLNSLWRQPCLRRWKLV